jgi:hypothetical protein
VTYDAVLVARRGLGAAELELAGPGFLAAVRWASYAIRICDGLDDLKAIADEKPSGLAGQSLIDFQAKRSATRAEIKQRRVRLLLEDPDPPKEAPGG